MPPFGCSAQEVLLCTHLSLTEEGIAACLTLVQRLEVTLQTLTSAIDMAGKSLTFISWINHVGFFFLFVAVKSAI